MKLSIFSLFLLFLLVSCGDNKNPKMVQDSGEYAYAYTVGTCFTGDHKFSSRAEMCLGLKNQTLNNNCAEESRKDYFRRNCPDFSWE